MNLSKLLDSAPNVVSLFFGLSVVISVVYEYSFFKTFGISLSQLPSSISDHLKSSIDIYFYSILLCAFILSIVVFAERKYNSSSVTDINSERRSLRRNLFDLFVMVVFLLQYIYIVIFHPADSGYVFLRATSFVVVLMCLFNVYSENLESIFGFLNAHKILLMSFVLAIIYHVAIYDALLIKKGEGVRVNYSKINGNSNYFVVKTFSSHYVFWDKDGEKLIYEKVSDVDALSVTGK